METIVLPKPSEAFSPDFVERLGRIAFHAKETKIVRASSEINIPTKKAALILNQSQGPVFLEIKDERIQLNKDCGHSIQPVGIHFSYYSEDVIILIFGGETFKIVRPE